MNTSSPFLRAALALSCAFAFSISAQNREDGPPFGGPPNFNGPPGGPGGFGPGPGRGFGGPGGPGGPMQEERKLVKQFDKDGDKRLDAAERKAAREFIAREKAEGRGPRRPGPPGGRGREENQPPPTPGARLKPSDVKSFTTEPLFDPGTLRTVFIEFENTTDWEKELSDFYHTDVEVPVKLTVDGKTYRDVGIHFRGASSFFTVGEGRKKSLGLSIDFVHNDQRLLGCRNLDLLNSHEDPSFLRSVLYLQTARDYIPAPKANFMRVVINGESWGVYVGAQHFDKDFIHDNFKTTQGARWKVPGSPRAQGGLKYLGEDVAEYKKHYEIKSKDDPKAWADLIKLCRVIDKVPTNQLVAALEPILDIDGALKFLALDNALINNDGYWIRTSDYSIHQDEKGRFHLVPHDANETFTLPGGPGFGGGPGGRRGGPGGGGPGGGGPGGGGPDGGGGGAQIKGVELHPLIAATNANKPLAHKLLAVPALRAKYLGHVRDIAERSLDWNKLGPVIQRDQALISEDVKNDTRKLDTFEAFTQGATEGTSRRIGLKSFADQRRAYLLGLPEVKNAGK